MDGLFNLSQQAMLVSWPGGSWQNTVKVVLAGLITYLLVLWVLMVWWTFRDIRERTRDPFLQAAAVFVVLVFSLPGLWIYLIGRPKETLAEAYARTLEEEALLQELEDLKACPTCRRRVQEDFVVCPVCQTRLKEPCTRCSRPLSHAWAACPYCATPRRMPAVERQVPARAVDTAESPTVVVRRGRTLAPSTPAVASTLTETAPTESA
jgi:RNA polymerase subunit RPABC4/transcription elongation factor Spt4